jgi:hypothetical protein
MMGAAGIRRRSFLVAMIVLIDAVAGGCIGQPQGSSVRRAQVGIVTHRDLGGGPAAIIGGTLGIDQGCVVIRSPDGIAIPMWPPGTTAWDVDGVLVIADRAGTVAARQSDEAFFGGGTDYPRSFVHEIADAPIPPACDRQATYMLINSLERLEP